MIAVVAGSGAALAFAVSTMCSARASRAIGAAATLAWVAVIGLAITVPFAVASGVPRSLDVSAALWLAAAGIRNTLGLLFAHRGVRTRNVANVAPILSVEGAAAARLPLAGGQSPPGSAPAPLAPIAA